MARASRHFLIPRPHQHQPTHQPTPPPTPSSEKHKQQMGCAKETVTAPGHYHSKESESGGRVELLGLQICKVT